MKIKEAYPPTESIGQYLKFLSGKYPFGPARFRAEQTIKVTHIRYFKIASGYHGIISIKEQLQIPYKYTGII